MHRSAAAALALVVLAGTQLHAQTDAKPEDSSRFARRAEKAAEAVRQLVAVSDSAPPQSLLRKATCIAVVPGVKQAGFVVGGRLGYGVVSCRVDRKGEWSTPVFIALKGGSVGLQIGGQESDVVLVFLNGNAPAYIGRSSFNLGGQVSVAAGPVGRDLTAETDYRATAEILSYSRSRGLFAGLNLAGTKWEIDDNANEQVYGKQVRAEGATEALLRRPGDTAPTSVRPFVDALTKNVPG